MKQYYSWFVHKVTIGDQISRASFVYEHSISITSSSIFLAKVTMNRPESPKMINFDTPSASSWIALKSRIVFGGQLSQQIVT